MRHQQSQPSTTHTLPIRTSPLTGQAEDYEEHPRSAGKVAVRMDVSSTRRHSLSSDDATDGAQEAATPRSLASTGFIKQPLQLLQDRPLSPAGSTYQLASRTPLRPKGSFDSKGGASEYSLSLDTQADAQHERDVALVGSQWDLQATASNGTSSSVDAAEDELLSLQDTDCELSHASRDFHNVSILPGFPLA